jgi:hypothetical protein
MNNTEQLNVQNPEDGQGRMFPIREPKLGFGLFRRREQVHFPFGSRYGAEFLYCLGLAGT